MPCLLAGVFLLGCSNIGNQTPYTNNLCTSTSAEIMVYDTDMQILCGCQESGTVPVQPPTALTCTVSQGSSVTFVYSASDKEFHLIVSLSSPSFTDSPIYNPHQSSPVSAYTATFTGTGSYQFEDQYNAALNGVIVVQ